MLQLFGSTTQTFIDLAFEHYLILYAWHGRDIVLMAWRLMELLEPETTRKKNGRTAATDPTVALRDQARLHMLPPAHNSASICVTVTSYPKPQISETLRSSVRTKLNPPKSRELSAGSGSICRTRLGCHVGLLGSY